MGGRVAKPKSRPRKKKATKLSAKDARELLRKEHADRIKACSQELNKVLAKHECSLVGKPDYHPDPSGGWRTVVEIQVMPVPRQEE